MSWSQEQFAHVVELLRKLLRPDREVLMGVSNEVHSMQAFAEFPAILAQILGYGPGTTGDTPQTIIGVRQAAGVLLRQHIQGLCKQIRAQSESNSGNHQLAQFSLVSAQSIEVPLLVALCSVDSQIRTAASCCISALLSLEAVVPSNPERPWALSLVSRLEQLAEAGAVGDEGSGLVSTLAGVARCLGIIFEDSALDAIHGALSGCGNAAQSDVMGAGDTTQFSLRMYALLSHVLQVNPGEASASDVLEIRLHALRTTSGIAFVGALDDFYFESDEEGEEDDSNGLRVDGVSPHRARDTPQQQADKKAQRAAVRDALRNAELNLTVAVMGCLDAVVGYLTAELSSGGGTSSRLHAIRGLEVVVRALMPLVAYWSHVGPHILNDVLPVVVRWLGDVGASSNRDASISGPTSSFLSTCVDFITEISQQIDDEAVNRTLSQIIPLVLHGLLCATELDAVAMEDFTVGPDADQEDVEGDVMFIQNRRRNKGGGNNEGGNEATIITDEDGGEFADNAFDDEDGAGEGHDDALGDSSSHPLRGAVGWCISNLSMVVQPSILRGATFEMLSSVVDRQVGLWRESGSANPQAFLSHLPNWTPLEAALSLLTEVLDHTSMDFGGDEDADSIMESMRASQTAMDLCSQLLSSAAPHPAGPVRQSAAALLRRIVVGMFGFNNLILMDDADVLEWSQEQVTTFTVELSRRVNEVATLLTSLITTDSNKAVRLTCIAAVVSILHRHFLEDHDDDDEDDSDHNTAGSHGVEGGMDVHLVHVFDDTIRNFLAVTASLPQLTMRCRVAWYRSLSRVVKMEAETEVDGSASVFMSCIGAVFEHLQAYWTKAAQTSFETYESLAIGEVICDLLDAVSEIPNASCPTSIVAWLWNQVCERILISKVDPSTSRFAPTDATWGPLSFDAIIMAVEIASCACDSLEGLDKAATSSLFNSTSLIQYVAELTERIVSIVTSQRGAESPFEAELLANCSQCGELLRASFGLMADFITAVDASTVSSVGNSVLSMIFKILQKECQRRSTPSVSNYDGQQMSSDATSAALANSLWCFLALINKIMDGSDRQTARSLLKATLVEMCPDVFAQPQGISGSLFFLMSSLHEESLDRGVTAMVDTTGRSTVSTTMFNCLFVVVKCASAFEISWFGESGASNVMLLVEATVLMSEEGFEPIELLNVGAGMGEVLTAVAPYANNTKQFLKAVLILAGHLSDHMMRAKKMVESGKSKSLSQSDAQMLGQLISDCFQVWNPVVRSVVQAAGGAAGAQTYFTKKQKRLAVSLGEVFLSNQN